jgi:hypothetical protein
MSDAFWMLIPDNAYILVLVGIGLLTTIGFFSAGRGIRLVLMVCVMAFLGPFIAPSVDLLPDWALGLLCLWLALTLIGAVLGRRVMENVLSMIIFSFLAFPFRALGRLIRMGRWLH